MSRWLEMEVKPKVGFTLPYWFLWNEDRRENAARNEASVGSEIYQTCTNLINDM